MTVHLGPAATAFVDGQLDHSRRDEVAAHLLHCAPCRAEVDGLRALKNALRSRGPEVPFELGLRLLSVLPEQPSGPPVRRVHSRSRVRRTAVGGALVALGIGGSLSLAGPPPAGPTPRVDPASTSFVIDHGQTAGEVPFTEPQLVNVSSAGALR